MHDPSTLAFSIRSPFRRAPDNLFKSGYRPPFIDIWHEDPLKFEGKCGGRDDDSCGWHSPLLTVAERAAVEKLAKQQYSQIFEKQVRAREGASYAHICFEPTAYDAVYWSWRAIKAHGRVGWQWGDKHSFLTSGELEQIYLLSANPVDNFRRTVATIGSEEDFISFFMLVHRAYRGYSRPWYKHPRWHFWHWRLQIHPWQQFRRWAFSRCAGCGKRFPYGYSPVGQWDPERPKPFRSEKGVYHFECANLVMAKPEGRA